MLISKRSSGRASSMPAGLAWGAMVSIVTTLIAAAVQAVLLDAEKIGWENIGYGIVLLLLLSSFLGALTAYSKIKRQRLLVCLISSVIYFGILLSITALFFGGQYQAVSVTAALTIAGGAAAGLLGLNGRKTERGRKRHHR